MIKRKYYKKNGRWRWHNEWVGSGREIRITPSWSLCQGCKRSVLDHEPPMEDQKFYQVRIDGVFKYRCWNCYSSINGMNKSNVEETARIGEYFETIF